MGEILQSLKNFLEVPYLKFTLKFWYLKVLPNIRRYQILYKKGEILSSLRKYLKIPTFYTKNFSISRYLVLRDTTFLY